MSKAPPNRDQPRTSILKSSSQSSEGESPERRKSAHWQEDNIQKTLQRVILSKKEKPNMMSTDNYKQLMRVLRKDSGLEVEGDETKQEKPDGSRSKTKAKEGKPPVQERKPSATAPKKDSKTLKK